MVVREFSSNFFLVDLLFLNKFYLGLLFDEFCKEIDKIRGLNMFFKIFFGFCFNFLVRISERVLILNLLDVF